MNLPTFKYHPDPVATGSVIASPKRCCVCKQTTGFIYKGPYRFDDLDTESSMLDPHICPWCIENGNAAEALGISFNDLHSLASIYLDDLTISEEAAVELCRRTPGYPTWQDHLWIVHCKDACQFLGPAGGAEIKAKQPDPVHNSLNGVSSVSRLASGKYACTCQDPCAQSDH